MAATEQRETKANQSAHLIFFTWNSGSAEVLANLVGSSEAIQSNSTIVFMEEQINYTHKEDKQKEHRSEWKRKRRAEDLGTRPG